MKAPLLHEESVFSVNHHQSIVNQDVTKGKKYENKISVNQIVCMAEFTVCVHKRPFREYQKYHEKCHYGYYDPEDRPEGLLRRTNHHFYIHNNYQRCKNKVTV